MRKKIIIVRPIYYAGGTLVLSEFCKLLRQKGYDAKLFFITGSEPKKNEDMKMFWNKYFYQIFISFIYRVLIVLFPNTKNKKICEHKKILKLNYYPVLGTKCKWLPFFSKNNTIVVYPEKVYGNFLKAKHVVRWLLYYYPYKDDKEAYSKNDLFVCYRTVFNDWNLNPKGYTVRILSFNNELYHRYNYGQRNGNCYIIRKGVKRKDLPEKFDGPVVDTLLEEDKVKVFNECKYCYSYDLQTFYSTIASVCGCISIVVMEPGKSSKDYYSNDELKNHVGVAYGNTQEEIQHSIQTKDTMMENLDFTQNNEEDINKFIEITNAIFK